MVVKLISSNNRVALYENVTTFKENPGQIELSYGKFKDDITTVKIDNSYLNKFSVYADDYSLLHEKEVEKEEEIEKKEQTTLDKLVKQSKGEWWGLKKRSTTTS